MDFTNPPETLALTFGDVRQDGNIDMQPVIVDGEHMGHICQLYWTEADGQVIHFGYGYGPVLRHRLRTRFGVTGSCLADTRRTVWNMRKRLIEVLRAADPRIIA